MVVEQKHIIANFITRVNRFTITCKLRNNNTIVKAYLPNTGRLYELLLPGIPIFLEKSTNTKRILLYTVIGMLKNNQFILLHTHRVNDLVFDLLNTRCIPSLKEWKVISREVSIGHNRFDFLLRNGDSTLVLEVKCCTLFGRYLAMFPDAVTSRGTRHLNKLMALNTHNIQTAIFFFIQNAQVTSFLPNYHIDPIFAETLVKAHKTIKVIAGAISFNPDFSLSPMVRELTIPWKILANEALNCGCYMIVFHLTKSQHIKFGKAASNYFQKGYYIYVGSAKKNLTQRIERHRRKRKKLFWHIDYFSKYAKYLTGYPIRTNDDLECLLALAVNKISLSAIPRFGASDCSCPSHLFRFSSNPLSSKMFHDLVDYFRMDRLFLEKAGSQKWLYNAFH